MEKNRSKIVFRKKNVASHIIENLRKYLLGFVTFLYEYNAQKKWNNPSCSFLHTLRKKTEMKKIIITYEWKSN